MEIASRDAFVVVDVQNDFCAGGPLAVPGAEEIIEVIRQVAGRFEHIILTQDWHPPGHCSFASSDAQGPWPDHCIQGTPGADFHPALELVRSELILRKGFRQNLDSYSAFFENDQLTPTGLGGYCRERGFKRIFFAGLAYDFCVGFSAVDARKLGFESTVISDASRAIGVNGSEQAMEAEFARCGVVLAKASSLMV